MALRWLTLLKTTVCRRPQLRLCKPSCQLMSCTFTSSDVAMPMVVWTGAMHLLHPRRMCSNFGQEDKAAPESSDSDGQSNLDEAPGSSPLENLSPEEEHRLRVLQVEYDVWQALGHTLPSSMPDKRWLLLLGMETERLRLSVYENWHNYDVKKEEIKLRKLQERELEEQCQETTFVMIPDFEQRKQHYSNNLAHAMVHGIPLVFDMDFERQMNDMNQRAVAQQLRHAFHANWDVPDPFHFFLTGVKPGSITDQNLNHSIINYRDYPITVKEGSYLDYFPKERLVYLTPDSPHLLGDFNPDDIYIVGGLADKKSIVHWTIARAKQQGVRTAKFPLDKYLKWRQGTKGLTLFEVVNIMQDMKTLNDWTQALDHVPAWKFEWRL